MTNANSEGHPGWLVSGMRGVAAQDLAQKPNIVLIYVGTNDMIFGNAAKARSDMQKLVAYLTTNLPDSLIVVSKLFISAGLAAQVRIERFNAQLSATKWPANVVLADLSSALLLSDLGPDGIHPNDGGYAKMAAAFYDVLSAAVGQGRVPDVTARFPPLAMSCNGPAPVPAPVKAPVV